MSTETASPNRAYLDALKVLERYRTEGVTREESDTFLQAAIDELEGDTSGKYAENVAQVGQWAIEVDEAFDRVTRGFNDLVGKFGGDFPDLKTYFAEWSSYNKRWVDHLHLSRDVASEHAAILKRFDKVYIDMVLSIQTTQDREDVILELGTFIDEEHDRSTEMSQGFLNLKRDIEDFVRRFDAWIVKTGEELIEQATILQQEIEQLKVTIQGLDEQIKEAAVALLLSAAAAGTMVGLIALAVTGTVLLVLIGQRLASTLELQDKQKELADVNRMQEGLANIKSEFDGLRPDIYLICDRLVLFAEIWSSVRNQAVQFRESLKGGMDASTNARFKLELKLAQELCTPLVNGLESYATQLQNRLSTMA